MNRATRPELLTTEVSSDSTARGNAPQDITQSATQSQDPTERCLVYQEQSWRTGERCPIEQLVQLFPLPIGPTGSEALLALICHERVLREERGESPTLIEYQQRFADLAEALRIQWEIDDLLSSNASDVADAQKPAVTKCIGRYEIQAELGRGAIGVVYLAWDPQLKRKIAIKRLRTGVDSSTEEVVRIKTEAEAVAQLQHPGIVQIFDVGEAYDLPYLAMEFCSGGNLATRLDGKPIMAKTAAELVRKICDGVAAAHQRRIIHRDLKPKNVLLERDDDWSPKVSDFGLAKLLDNDSTATASGSILGSPAYMAPEQAFGDGKRVGPAADIYSLGAILYECLTGRAPFLGVTIADTLEQVRQREPVRVRQLEPHVPIDLETIAHKCLRKDPLQRYETVAQLHDDLTRFLNHQPIHARRERWIQTIGRLAKKYPLVAGLATTSALLLVAVTAVSLAFVKRMADALVRIRDSEVETQLVKANALVSGAHGIRVTREPGQRFEALESLRKAAKIGNDLNRPLEWYDSMRDEAIGALVLPDAHIAEFRNEGQQLKYSDFSDNHQLLALSFETGPISIRRMSDQRELTTLPRLDATSYLGFVDDTRLFQAGMPGGAVELWSLEQNVPKRVWKWTQGPNLRAVEPGSLRAINRKVTIACKANVAEVLSTSDGSTIAQFLLEPHTREPTIALHPTHPYLALYSYTEPGMELRNWETGETILKYRMESQAAATFTGAAWSSDGKRLAMAVGQPSADVLWFRFDPSTKQLTRDRELRSHPGLGGGGPTVSFNASGDRLLVFGWNQSLGFADANLSLPLFSSHAAVSTTVRMIKSDPQEKLAGLFRSPDNLHRYGMMKIAHGRERTILSAKEEAGGTLAAVDPTGRILAFAYGGKLSVIDVASKRLLLTKRWQNLSISAICFTDGYLVINSGEVVCRFPYKFSASSPATLTFGMPERVHIPPGTSLVFGASRDCETIAVGCVNSYGTVPYAGGWAKLAEEPAARKILDQESGLSSQVSNDGQRIVFETESGTYVFPIGDRHPGQPKLLSKVGGTALAKDGALIVTANAIVKTDDWESTPRTNAGVPGDISRDNNQIASTISTGKVCLVDKRTENAYARIEGLHPVWLPDASKVITRIENGRHALYDLKLIRQGVLELGIPWTGPDYADCVEPASIESAKFADELANVETGADLVRKMDQHCEERAGQQPNDGHLAFSAAMISIDRRDWEEALERLDRACELLPAAITPRQWRAYLLAEMRRWPAAIADADWVLEQTADPRFQLHRAEWLYRNHDFTRSIEQCDEIIANAKAFATLAYGLRHFNHAALGRVEEASKDRDYFIRNTSHDERSLNIMAFYMVNDDISLRHPVLAKLHVEKMLAMQAEHAPDVRDTIGLVYFRNDEYAKAIDVLSSNLTDVREELIPCALSVMAMSAAQLRDLDTARHHLDELEKWKPSPEVKLSSLLEIQKLKFEALRLCK